MIPNLTCAYIFVKWVETTTTPSIDSRLLRIPCIFSRIGPDLIQIPNLRRCLDVYIWKSHSFQKKHGTRVKHPPPGDSIRDLFIPKRWRSPAAFEFGSRLNSPSQKGHVHSQNCQAPHLRSSSICRGDFHQDGCANIT